jgi:type II secretory pathway component PulF
MRIARRLPLIGKTIECLSLSRFAWTASIAENAGMEAGETMQMALESTQNYYYERLIPEVTRGVRGGRQFHPTLRATGAFPADFLDLVENGETAGELAETMQRASDQLHESAENNLKTIAVVGFVVCFCFVAIVVGVTVISLFKQVYLRPLQEFM